jgi:hypothetical protein
LFYRISFIRKTRYATYLFVRTFLIVGFFSLDANLLNAKVSIQTNLFTYRFLIETRVHIFAVYLMVLLF